MARRLTHQLALDGLRAIAVIAVLLYHADAGPFRGGFLGVDVFFVLSGYLITLLLLTEYAERGTVDLPVFWARRARRLFPALFLMLVAVVVGTRLVNADRLASVRTDAVSTFFYAANWRFASSGQSYFAQFLEPSPLVHTWSLAIEEQFYLLFPILLLVALRLLRGRTRPLAVGLAVLALASAALMAVQYTPSLDPSLVYYSTFTRAQDLLVGAVLAVLAHRVTTRQPPGDVERGSWIEPAGWAGAAVVVGACLLISESDAQLFRGGFLVVALATALLIRAVTQPGSRLGRALSWRPLRGIGLVSYGLYLWHWPVFVAVSQARTGIGGLSLTAIRFALTGAVAYLSYRFLELPVREGRLGAHLRRRWRVPTAVAACVAVLATVLLVPGGKHDATDDTAGSGALATHVEPSTGGRLSVLVAGDSTARDLAGHLPAAVAAQLAVSSSTLTGCGIAVQAVVLGDQRTPEQVQCRQWPSDWSRAVATTDPSVAVLVVGTWEVFDHLVRGRVLRVGTAAYHDYLRGVYEKAVAVLGAGGRPVVVLDVPCFARIPWAPTGVDVSGLQNDPRRARFVNAVLADLATSDPGLVTVLHQSAVLCDGNTPVTSASGQLLRPDGVHVGNSGGKAVWDWLAPQLIALAQR